MAPPDHQEKPQRGGISLTTLIIASVASACAAYVVSRVWGAGTLFGAAATPVIVALVSEGLRRPVEKIPPIPVVRARAPADNAGSPPRRPPAAAAARATDLTPPPEPPAPSAPHIELPPSFTAPRRVYTTSRRQRWRVALLTGLAAFALVAVVYTVIDLASGSSVTGHGRNSSLFDFSTGSSKKATKTTVTTTTTTTATQTQPTRTVTVPAKTTATTPTVTVTTPATTTATTPATTTPPLGAQATTPTTTATTTSPAPTTP